MPPRKGLLRPVVLLGFVALGAACTEANPAFRGVRGGFEDAASDEFPAPALIPDAGDASDLFVGEEGSPDTGLPDTALAPDAAPPPDTADLAPRTPDVAALAPDVATLNPDLPPDAVGGAVTKDLVAYWPFDEGSGSMAYDVSTRNNHGVLMLGAAFTGMGFPAAKFPNRGSLSLGGVDEYVDIMNRSIPANQAAKTVAFWFRAVNPSGLPIRTILSLADIESDDVGLQIGLDQGRIAIWTFGDLMPMVAGSTVDGNWRHAAVTYDGAGKYVLYYEGNMQGSPFMRVATRGEIVNPRIGTWEQPEEMYQGALDDLRIYARALTLDEIRALAAGQ